MSKTLNLVDRLLDRSRRFRQIGRTRDALHFLHRLAKFQSLPADIAEETQALLADIRLSRGKYARARRHLVAALVYQPDSAWYHYLLGSALASDERGDRHRAAEHYEKAIALDPDNPQFLSEFGILALRLGRTDEGLQCLKKAVKLAPNDPELVERLAEGLREENRADEGRRELQFAMFRNPRNSAFRQLYNEFQFRLLHDNQSLRWRTSDSANDTAGPIFLPFVRLITENSKGQSVRRDPPSRVSSPHRPKSRKPSHHRHASSGTKSQGTHVAVP